MKRLLLSIITFAVCVLCSGKTVTLSINGIRETDLKKGVLTAKVTYLQ